MNALKPILGWLLTVAFGVAGLAINHSAGYDAGYAAAKAEGEQALAHEKEAHETERRQAAEAKARDLEAAAKELVAEQVRGAQLAADLGAENARLRSVTDKLNGDIQRVTTLYRRALDAAPEPQPAAVFTAGFVRVWNSALFGTANPVPATGSAPSRADAPSAGANPADDLIVGITRADLLANQVRNSEGYASCRAQLKKLIEWNSKNGRK